MKSEWKETYLDALRQMGACENAKCHANDSAAETFDEFWRSVGRADWMFWLATRLMDRKAIVRAACDIARAVLHLAKKGENRPREAIEAAEKWCDGEVKIEDVRSAAYAAYAAYANAANADAAAYAAYAAYAAAAAAYAAYAAYAPDAAANAAYAAYAPDAAANAAYAAYAPGAAYDAAKLKEAIKINIEIIIRHFPSNELWNALMAKYPPQKRERKIGVAK